jgi:hypothetical protein
VLVEQVAEKISAELLMARSEDNKGSEIPFANGTEKLRRVTKFPEKR